MAQSRGDLSGFVEFDELLVKIDSVLEGEHRPLTAGHDNGIELIGVDLGGGSGVFGQRGKIGRGDETHADEVAG